MKGSCLLRYGRLQTESLGDSRVLNHEVDGNLPLTSTYGYKINGAWVALLHLNDIAITIGIV